MRSAYFIFSIFSALFAASCIHAIPVVSSLVLEARVETRARGSTRETQLSTLAQVPNFITSLRTAYQASRIQTAGWQSNNFAVMYYEIFQGGQWVPKMIDSYNAGSGNQHSEEAIFGDMNAKIGGLTSWRPLAIFTERQPCSSCATTIEQSVRTKAVSPDPANPDNTIGYVVPIYYISTYPPANVSQIRTWWN
ncbi:hypothetical protein BKA62DRAFT_708884 [Auriculariales sp. MPI-PUGE-AT-0066]|nr:hypothetical protein BKA62DRAFT_708884 [Auriculariales sp. MPI-PUGE-AT-0066]